MRVCVLCVIECPCALGFCRTKWLFLRLVLIILVRVRLRE